jgi:hypothetical protein
MKDMIKEVLHNQAKLAGEEVMDKLLKRIDKMLEECTDEKKRQGILSVREELLKGEK